MTLKSTLAAAAIAALGCVPAFAQQQGVSKNEILIGTILDELERTDGQFGLVTMCAGGGMAPAIIIERV